MLLINKNDWWASLIRILVIIAIGAVIAESASDGSSAGQIFWLVILSFFLLFAWALLATAKEWKGNGLSIYFLALGFGVFLLNVAEMSALEAVTYLPTVVAFPKVILDRYTQYKSGENRKLKGLIIGSVVLVFFIPLFLFGMLIAGLSDLGDPEVMKKNGIEHANSEVIPELWLDQYPRDKIQIKDAYYELFHEFIAGATFGIDPSIDLHQYVTEHPGGRSGRWTWKSVEDSSGNIIKYEALLFRDAIQVDEFTYEHQISGDNMTEFTIDLDAHEITYSERDD